MDKYSTSMKKFADYIGRKFSYGVDIHRYLENNMNTGVPSPTRLTGPGTTQKNPVIRSSCERK